MIEKSNFRIWVHYKFNLMIGSRNSTPLHSRATFVLLRKVVEKLLFRKGSLAWLLVKYAFVFYASFFFLSESGRSRTAAEWRWRRVAAAHSVFKSLKPAKNNWTWTQFTNFSKQVVAYSHYFRFRSFHMLVFKICWTAACISTISQCYDFFNPIFGGFL